MTTFNANINILIIDDELLNRKLLQTLLHHDGYKTQTAVDVEEAFKYLRQSTPDLILLDVMLPGIDGYHFAGLLKDNLAWRNIPIIIVTALTDRNSHLIGLMVGANDVLTKPINRSELILKIKTLLHIKELAPS